MSQSPKYPYCNTAITSSLTLTSPQSSPPYPSSTSCPSTQHELPSAVSHRIGSVSLKTLCRIVDSVRPNSAAFPMHFPFAVARFLYTPSTVACEPSSWYKMMKSIGDSLSLSPNLDMKLVQLLECL